MKKCPFCAEQIQDDAVKCRFCGEFLSGPRPSQTKWYFSTPIIVIAILCIGPFALPLVWFNRRYKIITRLVVTVVVIVVTALLYFITVGMYSHLMEQMNQLGLR